MVTRIFYGDLLVFGCVREAFPLVKEIVLLAAVADVNRCLIFLSLFPGSVCLTSGRSFYVCFQTGGLGGLCSPQGLTVGLCAPW